MGNSRLIWQAQSRDDLVIHTIVEQLTRTAGAKQIMMKYYFQNETWAEQHFDEFLSHLHTLYDLATPIAPIHPKENDKSGFVFDESIKSNKRVRPALDLFTKIMYALKQSGIWNVRKSVKFSRKQKGEHSVRGI